MEPSWENDRQIPDVPPDALSKRKKRKEKSPKMMTDYKNRLYWPHRFLLVSRPLSSVSIFCEEKKKTRWNHPAGVEYIIEWAHICVGLGVIPTAEAHWGGKNSLSEQFFSCLRRIGAQTAVARHNEWKIRSNWNKPVANERRDQKGNVCPWKMGATCGERTKEETKEKRPSRVNTQVGSWKQQTIQQAMLTLASIDLYSIGW